MKKKILVTGIGGNVGQGIIRNIRNIFSDIIIIGTNISEFSSGNYLCDSFYCISYAYDIHFISQIIDIINREKIDLIIPSTDYEGYFLAKHRNEIPCSIAISSKQTMKIFLDKYLTYINFKKHNLPFAQSFLPSQYTNNCESIIIKPRKGRGSRGIVVNPKSLLDFSDDEYLVQNLLVGNEITTAFYVDKAQEVHGHITMYRSLENGTTTFCKVTKEYDTFFNELLPQILTHFPIFGSANIQSIVTKSGNIVPFEINCRISGTNSIRSHFGFEDVKYTIEEYLYHRLPSKPNIIDGVATRILMDIIYPNERNELGLQNNSHDFQIF